ncbi:MAG: hypothetical protein LCH41_01015 [Armatimonadetes bacterium]|nr:hypothetical protein [Armatimonadota bacterium]
MSHQMVQQTSFKLSKFYRALCWITFLGVGGFFGLFLVWVVLEPELRQPVTLSLGLLTLGGGTILYGWYLLAITREIVVTEEAIELRSKLKTRRILWEEVVEITLSEPSARGYVIRTATRVFNLDITGIENGRELLNYLSEFAQPVKVEFPVTWVPIRDTLQAKLMAPLLLAVSGIPFCALLFNEDGRTPFSYATCVGAVAFTMNYLAINARRHRVDEDGITVPTILGHRTMLWRNVRKVVFGGRGSLYSFWLHPRHLVLWSRGWPIVLLPGSPAYYETRSLIFAKVAPSALPREDAPF